MKTFHDYHDEETTGRHWRRKSAVVKPTLDANGMNDYELPHGYENANQSFETSTIVQATRSLLQVYVKIS